MKDMDTGTDTDLRTRLAAEMSIRPAQTLRGLARTLGCTAEWVRRMLLDSPEMETRRRDGLTALRAQRRQELGLAAVRRLGRRSVR